MSILTSEEITELKDIGHVCIHLVGTALARAARLHDLKAKYDVECKEAYNSQVYIVKERPFKSLEVEKWRHASSASLKTRLSLATERSEFLELKEELLEALCN
jgi:hypothetical protein